MQRVVFHEKFRRSSRPTTLLLKGVYTFNEQYLFIYFIYFYQNYVLSRNVANLLNIFSLIVFAVKALKSDVLC